MTVTIAAVSPTADDVLALLKDYINHVHHVTGLGQDGPEEALVLHQDHFLAPIGAFLAARDDTGRPVGCGGVRLLDPHTAEVKRLWVTPSARGAGVGRRLLAGLEAAAVDLGARRAVLDTRAELVAALHLYRSTGWQLIPAYIDGGPATHWFGKTLT